MTTEEEMLENKYFIMLDVTNTSSENEIVSRSANIQIVSSSNLKANFDIKAIINRFGRALKFEEKRKHLFTITLNQDAGYKTMRNR